MRIKEVKVSEYYGYYRQLLYSMAFSNFQSLQPCLPDPLVPAKSQQ